jgi:hypothetical protein
VRVGKAHPGEIKPVHWLPTFVLLAFVFSPILAVSYRTLALVGYIVLFVYWILLSLDCYRVTRSFTAAFLAVPSAMAQFFGYGWGFLSEMFKK